MEQQEKYNFTTVQTNEDLANILINEDAIVKNNLIVDCNIFEKSDKVYTFIPN